jgi:hypothetical protein
MRANRTPDGGKRWTQTIGHEKKIDAVRIAAFGKISEKSARFSLAGSAAQT